MSAHIPVEELEALAAGEIADSRRSAIERHLAGCPECREESRWLEAERSLFSARRAEPRVEVAPLWPRVEAGITRRRRDLRRTLVLGAGLAAAAAVTLFLLFSDRGGPGGPAPAGVASDRTADPTDPSRTHAPAAARRQAEPPPAPVPDPEPKRQERAVAPEERAPRVTSTSRAVNGPIHLSVSSMSGSIEVRAGARDRVVLDTGGEGLARLAGGDGGNRFTVTLEGRKNLLHASIRIEVPPGSTLVLRTASGDLDVRGVGGDVNLQAASGDIRVERVRDVIAFTASGDMFLRDVDGATRARTASGDAQIATTGKPDARLDFTSASGDLRWRGACGRGCRLAMKSASGDAQLTISPESSFHVSFASMSGRLRDRLGLAGDTFGGGAGSVRFSSLSGSLELGSGGRR